MRSADKVRSFLASHPHPHGATAWLFGALTVLFYQPCTANMVWLCAAALSWIAEARDHAKKQ